MNTGRFAFDTFYTLMKPFVFFGTRKDPEKAHEMFVSGMRYLHEKNLDMMVDQEL